MTESNQEKFEKLESRIENMLDKLIETDEDLENNGSQDSLKFSEDISSSEVEKEEGEPFEKEPFNAPFFQNEDAGQSKLPNLCSKNFFDNSNTPNYQSNLNLNFPKNYNFFSNNFNPFSLNYFYAQNMNNQNNSNSNFFGLVNKNINNNTSQINNETLNTTASFSSYNDINNNNLTKMNNNNGFMNF